jgi:putative endonuclease
MRRTFWVYILASRSRVLYIGVTKDLARRLAQHRAGLSSFTARYRVDRLVYAEEHASPRDAIAREKQLKGWTRARKVALIEEHNPTWRDLDTERYA